MSVVRTLIGNVKGPQGATGATGATGAAGANGADGAAATVNVGTVSTTAYGNPAQVINSGTESAAVLDFVIPQGQPGEEVTDMSGLTLGTMTTQTSKFPTPQVGDNGAVLWGKVVKYFSDLRTLIGTKLNTANVVNNFTTTESGYALDARAGKTLSDSLTFVPLCNVVDLTTGTITLNEAITSYSELLIQFRAPSNTTYGYTTVRVHGWQNRAFSVSEPYFSVAIPGGYAAFQIISATELSIVRTDANVRRIFAAK